MNFTTKSFQYPILANDGSISYQDASIESCAVNLLNQFDLEFIKIPAGTFLMGSTTADTGPDAMPQHEVSVKSFLLAQASVTQDLYQAVVGNNPSFFMNPSLPVECIIGLMLKSSAIFFLHQLLSNLGFPLMLNGNMLPELVQRQLFIVER